MMPIQEEIRAVPDGARISHYEVISRIGVGGMGEVYKAWDSTLDRPIALKVLSPDLLQSADRVRRFVQEARAASALNHPHIVTIYEIGQTRINGDESQPAIHYIAMEFIEGSTLTASMRAGADPAKMLEVLAQVADGLAKAHGAGIVHRDLKPDNVMITADGYAKLVDFGVAKLTEARRGNVEATQEGMVVGTVGYMSPEQVQGQSVDQRADIFSLGCILYEMMTRQRPFNSDSMIDTMHKIVFGAPPPIEQVLPAAPHLLKDIVTRCLAKSPEDRYQSMREVSADLRALAHELRSLPAPQQDATVLLTEPVVAPSPAPASIPDPEPARAEQRAVDSPDRRAAISRRKKRITVAGVVSRAYKIGLILLVAVIGYLWMTYPDYSTIESPLQTFPALEAAREAGEAADWKWTPYGKISPNLQRAVVAELDPEFFERTETFSSIRSSIARSLKVKKMPRIPDRLPGASAVSRSAVRNSMLSPSNPLSRVQAAVFSVGLEEQRTRKEILELYLNTAKAEPGVFGVEAASRKFFDKSAASLTAEEAARLAIALKEPGKHDPSDPGERLRERTRDLMARMDAIKSAGALPASRRGGSGEPATKADSPTPEVDTEPAEDPAVVPDQVETPLEEPAEEPADEPVDAPAESPVAGQSY